MHNKDALSIEYKNFFLFSSTSKEPFLSLCRFACNELLISIFYLSGNIRHSSGKERAFIEILFLYCLHLMNFVTVILDYQSLKERTMKTKQKIQFNRGHASVKYLMAFLFIACGGLLLARNMQWITVPVYDLLVSWQAVVAVVGVYSLVRRHLVFGLILLGISADALNDQLRALCGTDMQAFMLPAILILIGIVTVFSHGGKSRDHGYGRTPEEFKTMNYTSADGFLHSENAFSGVRQVILDEMLKGGSIQTRFGGSIIDMRRTDIPVGETPLDVDCKFGGIELYVPADWTIKCLCSTFMGGYEDKRWEREENPQKVLVIRGTLSWSGLVVKN